jgi:hypothetical protein
MPSPGRCALSLKLRGSPTPLYAHSPMLGAPVHPMLDRRPPAKRGDMITGRTQRHHQQTYLSRPTQGHECNAYK